MLNTVYKDAIQRREKTLSMIKGPKFEQIVQKARQNWVEYSPQKKTLSLQELIVVSTAQNFKEWNFGW